MDPADQDVLALTQAYMVGVTYSDKSQKSGVADCIHLTQMRQLYWLCSGNRNQLEATQVRAHKVAAPVSVVLTAVSSYYQLFHSTGKNKVQRSLCCSA